MSMLGAFSFVVNAFLWHSCWIVLGSVARRRLVQGQIERCSMDVLGGNQAAQFLQADHKDLLTSLYLPPLGAVVI